MEYTATGFTALLISFALATSVSAAESGWYVSARVGKAKSDVNQREVEARLIGPVVANYFQGPLLLPLTLYVDSSINAKDSSFSLGGGYRLNPYLSFEAGYVDLGSVTYRADIRAYDMFMNQFGVNRTTADYKSAGLTLSATGSLPFARLFNAHGRLGILGAKTESDTYITRSSVGSGGAPIPSSSVTILAEEATANTIELLTGIGAGVNIGSRMGLSVDWTRYHKVGDKNKTIEANIDTLGLSATLFF